MKFVVNTGNDLKVSINYLYGGPEVHTYSIFHLRFISQFNYASAVHFAVHFAVRSLLQFTFAVLFCSSTMLLQFTFAVDFCSCSITLIMWQACRNRLP